jgi:cytochrome P450
MPGAEITEQYIDLSHPRIFQEDSWRPLFAKVRREDPVYFCPTARDGPLWSITRYADIVRVDTDPQAFSSSYRHGGVSLADSNAKSFIAQDAPSHTVQRKAVAPVVAPKNLLRLEAQIRERCAKVLDKLPRNEEFDWVDQVSVELTSLMLTTLFDHPVEDARRLVYWSNVITADLDDPNGPVRTEQERQTVMREFYLSMTDTWRRRQNEEPRFDAISIMAHDPSMREAPLDEVTGTFGLLLVGGNDTTRNTMSGAIWGFHQQPGEWRKLKANPNLMNNAVAELIRFQSPVMYERRTAMRDAEVGGKIIPAGAKVAMWYISGNRDESVFDRADDLWIDRPNARQHIAFGNGPHRCLGSRLAEMQLRILLEEMIVRDMEVEVLAAPRYAFSNLVRSPLQLPVRIKYSS